MAGEQEWLLPTKPNSTGEFLGFPVKCDSENWQWCFLMPRFDPKQEAHKKSLEEWRNEKIPKEKVEEWWNMVFKHACKNVKGYSKATGEMTKEDFHNKVREAMVTIFSGPACGFKMKTMESVDGDDLFLLIELPTEDDTSIDMAAKYELRVPVCLAAYKDEDIVNLGETCVAHTYMPTSEYRVGEFQKTSERGANFPVVPLPLYMRYDEELAKKNKFEKFREVDLMRLSQRRMREFVSFENLESKVVAGGICTQIFAVHHYNATEHFWNCGWSNFKRFLSFPSDRDIDDVRNYFGEEVAFFFHFFGFLTRWIAVPAILGFIAFFRQLPAAGLSVDQERIVQIIFATIIVAWSALFTAKYKQRANMKITQWGMKNWGSVAQIRKEFNHKKRGTWGETIQNFTHWKLAILFMIETIAFVAVANLFRMGAIHAMKEGHKHYFGLAPKVANKIGKLLITVNIKVVNAVWAALSPMLSQWENHRTDTDLKDSKVKKLFVVKFIVYYYPFFYIAFIKKYNEGCLSATRGCVPELKENLQIFFMTHVVTTVVGLLIPMAIAWYKIKGEIKHAQEKKLPEPCYSYVQAQAKCPAYDGDTNDFMELTLSFGFVVMFSVALPVMTFLFFLVNLVELKLLAYRMTSVNQRSTPKGQEGIGAWFSIIQSVCYVAVAVNVGMACFTMHPIIDHPVSFQLSMFILLEHLMLFLMFLVQAATPTHALAQEEADAFNESVTDEIMGGKNADFAAKVLHDKPTAIQVSGVSG